tara:strand:- start:106 stop:309 length:204 start_codon:yes stop_codon:yes gene_type:complete
MKHLRVGDKVCMVNHMSNKGKITEIYYKTVTHGSSNGSFSKMMWIKFVSILTGTVIEAKRQDVMFVD